MSLTIIPRMKKVLTFAAVFIAAGCSAQLAVPEIKGAIYSIKVHNQVLEADPQTGGRIASLKLDEENFFTGREADTTYWGSTFWPSPQKEWSRMSPPELDRLPYSVQIRDNAIKMVSQKDSKFGYVFTKEISGNTRNTSFKIKYTIANQSNQIRKVAPWEVTRVRTKGIAFYPKGTGERWGSIANLAEDLNGITWFVYQDDKMLVKNNKFFADGSEGWIAQVNGDMIFVKVFPDIPAEQAAPTEAELAVYANAGRTYVEIEQQGAYQELRPGDSLVWEVHWFLRKLPADVKSFAGSPTLVSYVRDLVNSLNENK